MSYVRIFYFFFPVPLGTSVIIVHHSSVVNTLFSIFQKICGHCGSPPDVDTIGTVKKGGNPPPDARRQERGRTIVRYRIDLGAWNSVFAVPTVLVDRHLKLAGAVQLKALLWLLRHGGEPADEDTLSAALGVSRGDVADAMLYWESCGLIVKEDGGYPPRSPHRGAGGNGCARCADRRAGRTASPCCCRICRSCRPARKAAETRQRLCGKAHAGERGDRFADAGSPADPWAGSSTMGIPPRCS